MRQYAPCQWQFDSWWIHVRPRMVHISGGQLAAGSQHTYSVGSDRRTDCGVTMVTLCPLWRGHNKYGSILLVQSWIKQWGQFWEFLGPLKSILIMRRSCWNLEVVLMLLDIIDHLSRLSFISPNEWSERLQGFSLMTVVCVTCSVICTDCLCVLVTAATCASPSSSGVAPSLEEVCRQIQPNADLLTMFSRYFFSFMAVAYLVLMTCFLEVIFNCSQWPWVLWRCWLGGRKGIRPVKTEWWGAGMVICLERGADLHMAQLMLLPVTVFYLSGTGSTG